MCDSLVFHPRRSSQHEEGAVAQDGRRGPTPGTPEMEAGLPPLVCDQQVLIAVCQCFSRHKLVVAPANDGRVIFLVEIADHSVPAAGHGARFATFLCAIEVDNFNVSEPEAIVEASNGQDSLSIWKGF